MAREIGGGLFNVRCADNALVPLKERLVSMANCWCAHKWAGALRVKFAIFFLLVRGWLVWCAGTFSNFLKFILTI